MAGALNLKEPLRPMATRKLECEYKRVEKVGFRQNHNFNKSELSALPAIAGVYAIEFPLGSYVGRSTNLRRRLLEHFRRAEKGEHKNLYINRIYAEFKDSCRVIVLQFAPTHLSKGDLEIWLNRREAYWMKTHGSVINIELAKDMPYDHKENAFQTFNAKKELEDIEEEIKKTSIILPFVERRVSDEVARRKAEVRGLERKLDEVSRSRTFIDKITGNKYAEIKSIKSQISDLRMELLFHEGDIGHNSPGELRSKIRHLRERKETQSRILKALQNERRIFGDGE